MQIFKTLMTSRIYGLTQESVHCLNIIDIVFADDKTVRDAWKDLYDKYCVQNPDAAQLKKIQNAQYKLLETISKSLGYKDKVTWETIQNPYVPAGMIKQWQEQAESGAVCTAIHDSTHRTAQNVCGTFCRRNGPDSG